MWVNGADISMLNEVERSGAKYYSNDHESDLMEILSKVGFNLIRLRLWVNPYSEDNRVYGGGTNDLNTTIELAKRVKDNGMQFMLDIHYSDFWTDPRKQTKPKSWMHLSFEQLEVQVYDYTIDVLKKLDESGCRPEFIQVGNEITNGFLWPEGELPEYQNNKDQPVIRDYTNFFRLLKSGIKAVRDSYPINLILHVDYGGDNGLYREWFDQATLAELDYDIIGLSYYPFWHNTLNHLKDNLNDISKRYEKQVMVVETSYPHTTEKYMEGNSILNDELIKAGGYSATVDGQHKFLYDLTEVIKQVPNCKGIGVVYWEPAWIPSKTTWATSDGQQYANDFGPEGNSWADQAIFDYDGKLLNGIKDILK